MWNITTQVIPVKKEGASGAISESFGNTSTGKQDSKKLQKTVILITAHKLGKVLM